MRQSGWRETLAYIYDELVDTTCYNGTNKYWHTLMYKVSLSTPYEVINSTATETYEEPLFGYWSDAYDYCFLDLHLGVSMIG